MFVDVVILSDTFCNVELNGLLFWSYQRGRVIKSSLLMVAFDMAECRESAQLLIALVHLPLLVFGLPYILWCVSCLRRVVAFWVKPGVLVVVVANSDTNLRMCNNISNASLVHYNYWCAYYPDTCHGHSSIRITLDTRHGKNYGSALNKTFDSKKVNINYKQHLKISNFTKMLEMRLLGIMNVAIIWTLGCTYVASEYNKYLYNIHKNDIRMGTQGTIRLWGLQELLRITVKTATEFDSLIVLLQFI
ncbi:hypothetical protein AGLY_011566 [Aphis glycines]|uniref:Uncharacterized protein n=1 Tax=Aphis glycines TaxID=307491 RepID=A0A6G0TC29_APHGL|nr:hypothetical protein AGLY_011566 [Aphis glycines]